MEMEMSKLFIVGTVIVIVVFVLVIIGLVCLNGESFKNLESFSNKFSKPKFLDTLVPANLGFRNSTTFYEDLDDGLKGTPLVNVSEVLTNRYPIAIETSTNWYSTQPLISSVGTDEGKLSDCNCDKFEI